MTTKINILTALSDNIKIDPTKCTFCGECVEHCILDNLRMRLSTCRQACPLGVNTQGYVQLIARGEDDKARAMVLKDLPFPEIICRICDHPCEQHCQRHERTGQGVAIRALKRYLFENQPAALPPVAAPTGQRVAVVGAGLAGLGAAFDLAVKGHHVTVFEASQNPGGLARWAIPSFRLPADVVERELGKLGKLGVEFRYGAKIASQAGLRKLEAEFDAVIVATGLGGDRHLNIDGEDLGGVHHAMSLLKAAKQGDAPTLGAKVIVIGGGNSAIDAAQTALRLGADAVTVVCLEARHEMPAFAHEVAEAEQEGVVFNCGWGPVRLAGKDGHVQEVILQRCVTVFDAQRAFHPRFDAGQTKTLQADAVIVAIGQSGDTLKLAGAGKLQADSVTRQTSRPKVFLAGDCHSGPSSAIRALASGREAAISVDRLLKGQHLRFGRTYAGPTVTDFEVDTQNAIDRPRTQPPRHKVKAQGDFGELEGVFTPEQAKAEAQRCYSCGGPVGYFRNCWFCLPCEVVCPEKALWVEIPYLAR